ncbi:MAG: radical SAM protein [Thermodesulfobacteriota bacterium]
MKIYLVSPRNPESFWTFDRILPSLNKSCLFPNLALPTLAAITPPEHQVVLCDENVRPIDLGTDADVVGVTGYVVHRRRIFEIVDAFKRRGKLVVVGGPFASLCPEELRGRADVVFVDEAEDTWPEFLRDHAAGRWRSRYVAQEKPSLHDSPCPRFDLLDVERYRTMTIQTARGCPFSCEFCDIIAMYGRRPRTKTVHQVMTELREVHRLGATNVFVVDDNFIGNKREAKALLRALAAWQQASGYPIELMTEASLNVAQDEELLQLLRRANFTTLFVGIESPRTSSLVETRKTQNVREDLMASVRRIQEAGIEVMAGMIVGFDGDDAAIFDEHFRFIQDARIPVSMTGMLNALPRTPLHERLREAGRLLAGNVGDQFVFSNVVPLRMSRLELYDGYKRLLQRLYAYGNYRRRAMALILRRGSTIRGKMLASSRDFGILVRLLWTCVLRASPRRAAMTLRLMGETALRRPRALRHAVVLALLHKHLYEYVRDTSRHLDEMIEQLRSSEPALADPEPARCG